MVFETTEQLLPSVCVSLSSALILGAHPFYGVESPSEDDSTETRLFGVVGFEGVAGLRKSLPSRTLLQDSSPESSDSSS